MFFNFFSAWTALPHIQSHRIAGPGLSPVLAPRLLSLHVAIFKKEGLRLFLLELELLRVAQGIRFWQCGWP